MSAEYEELKTILSSKGENFYWEDDLDESWKMVDEGDWTDEGKYQNCEMIVEKNGQYFAIALGRSGSYYTDWYYDEPECYPVERKEITTVKWVRK